MAHNCYSPTLRWLSLLLPISVYILIYFGALVTSNDAGLAVPDWPTSFGENMFLFPPHKWQGIIWYEHVHRLIASGIGALVLVMAVIAAFVEKRARVRQLVFAALLLVILQGIFGGMTVLMKLPTAISVLHGVTGQVFLLLTLAIAVLYWRPDAHRTASLVKIKRPAALLTLFVFVQLILGAFARHSQAGLAIPDFPTAGGQWLPLFDDAMFSTIESLRSAWNLSMPSAAQIWIHMAHRFWAIAVACGAVALSIAALKQKTGAWGKRGAILLLLFILAQILLGGITVLSGRHPTVTSLHVVFGAFILGTSFLLWMEAWLAGTSHQPSAAPE